MELFINNKTFNEWNNLKSYLCRLSEKNTQKGIIIKLILKSGDNILLGIGIKDEGFIQYTNNTSCYATINKRNTTNIQIFDFERHCTEIEEKHIISFDKILSILENCFYNNLEFDEENWVEI